MVLSLLARVLNPIKIYQSTSMIVLDLNTRVPLYGKIPFKSNLDLNLKESLSLTLSHVYSDTEEGVRGEKHTRRSAKHFDAGMFLRREAPDGCV